MRNQSVQPFLKTDRKDTPGEAAPEIVFGPRHGWASLNLAEVWRYRELLYFLVWRDVKVRYKQTIIGATWAVLKPFLTMVVFTILFGTLLGVPSSDVPYPIFAYTALLPWSFFATGLAQAGSSLVANANLISKVYFPRLIVPFASVLAAMVDFAVAFVVLLAMMLAYRIVPDVTMLMVPLFLLLAFLLALGGGLWLSALEVKYRDIGHTLPLLIQFWLFATPVAYPSELVPARWRLLYSLNPMVGVVEGFRWALLGTGSGPSESVFISTIVILAVFVSGLFFFRRAEREFADLV